MSSSDKPFTTVTLDDSTFAVARIDPRKPHFFEVVAIFYDAARAQSYADSQNSGSVENWPRSPLNQRQEKIPSSRLELKGSVRAKALF